MVKKVNINSSLSKRRDRKKENQEAQNEEVLKAKTLTKVIDNKGDLTHLNKSLIEKIDFEDKKYINRLYDSTLEIQKDENFEELKNSIKSIGLLNPVYLQLKDDNRYRIISGLRRSLACRDIIEENEKIRFSDKAVIFEDEIPENILDEISVDENTKRKDLTLLEQSYKLYKASAEPGVTIEDVALKYNMSVRHVKRIKGIMSYPFELKEIVNEVGPKKAEEINRLIKLKGNKIPIQNIVIESKFKTLSELTDECKSAKEEEKQKKPLWEVVKRKNKYTLVFNAELSEEIQEEIKKFAEYIAKEKI